MVPIKLFTNKVTIKERIKTLMTLLLIIASVNEKVPRQEFSLVTDPIYHCLLRCKNPYEYIYPLLQQSQIFKSPTWRDFLLQFLHLSETKYERFYIISSNIKSSMDEYRIHPWFVHDSKKLSKLTHPPHQKKILTITLSVDMVKYNGLL